MLTTKLATVNHKYLGLYYAMAGTLMGLSGWTASIIMRLELARSGAHFIAHESASTYNAMITLHGITMIFFLVMPFLWGGYGNTLQPLTVGSAEVALPSINNISLTVLLISFLAAISVILGEFLSGMGWVLYPPLSTSMHALSSVTLVGIAGTLLVNGTSSTMTSTNFIGIQLITKAQGMSVAVYAISISVVSFLLLASLPSLTGGVIMLIADTLYNTTFFDAQHGGDVLYWQHLFWVFGHPEVYVLIIPAFAIVTLTQNIALGTEVFGAQGMIAGILAIAVLGFIVWAHHMYATGMEADARAYFAAATYTIAVPSGLKILHWIATHTQLGTL